MIWNYVFNCKSRNNYLKIKTANCQEYRIHLCCYPEKEVLGMGGSVAFMNCFG